MTDMYRRPDVRKYERQMGNGNLGIHFVWPRSSDLRALLLWC